MYGYVVLCNYVVFEFCIESFVNFVCSSVGVVKSVQYEGVLCDVRDMQVVYIKILCVYKSWFDEMYVWYDVKDWNVCVNCYEVVSKSIMWMFGNWGDVVIVLGYSILIDWVFGVDEQIFVCLVCFIQVLEIVLIVF